MRVAALLAYVRLTDGGTVSLEEGATVPAEADTEHVLELLGKGVIELEEGESAPTLATEEDEPTSGQGSGAEPGNTSATDGEAEQSVAGDPAKGPSAEPVVTEPGTPAAKKPGPGRPGPGPRGGSPA